MHGVVGFGLLHIVAVLLYVAIPALILHGIIRLASRHEIRKSRT